MLNYPLREVGPSDGMWGRGFPTPPRILYSTSGSAIFVSGLFPVQKSGHHVTWDQLPVPPPIYFRKVRGQKKLHINSKKFFLIKQKETRNVKRIFYIVCSNTFCFHPQSIWLRDKKASGIVENQIGLSNICEGTEFGIFFSSF